jgi:ElaB/YqjD/DUF883 family membrane-anchored ribosome-binding protein
MNPSPPTEIAMTEQAVATKHRLIEDFNAVVEDTEKLLKALASTGAEKGTALRASAEQSLEAARARLKELQEGAYERSKVAARATDKYVHEHPWQSVGAVAAIAGLVGLLVGLMLARR